jgi:hypothetical protein
LSSPTSNNQAEYEAFLAGLRLAEDVGAKEVKIYTDSQLVVSQVLGEYQAKNDNLHEYLELVKEKIAMFDLTLLKSSMFPENTVPELTSCPNWRAAKRRAETNPSSKRYFPDRVLKRLLLLLLTMSFEHKTLLPKK